MTKKIFTIALAAIALCEMSVMAQSTDSISSRPERTAPDKNNKMYQPQTFTDFAFEGILLDVNQQARIDSLNAAYSAKAAQRKADRDGNKDGAKDKKDKKDCKKAQQQCNDSANCPVKMDKKMRLEQKAQDRREYISKVKEILTPEQYTIFLENITTMPVGHANNPVMAPGQKAKGVKMDKGGRQRHGENGKLRRHSPDNTQQQAE